MNAPNRVCALRAAAALVALVAVALMPPPALADLRVNNLEVYLAGQEVTVQVVLLDAIPPAFHEGLQSGIPAHVRYTVELWQYSPLWRDRLLRTVTIERQLAYNVVTKEYRVTSLKGETRPPVSTRDLRDAQRVISEVHSLKLGSADGLDAAEAFYVRVHAQSALNGENTIITRLAGTAAETSRQSDYRTMQRVH